MQDKTKSYIVTVGFVFMIILVFALNILVKDKEISTTERRKLAQLPQNIDEEISEKFEAYAMDQFIERDSLRKLKTIVSTKIFRKQDNNKLFKINEEIYKIEYPLNKKNVQNTATKIENVRQKYLQGMNVYYAIVPDKNYYLENDDYLKIDYNELKEIMQNKLTNMKYIDIWGDLELEDYYRTDTHWKQENLDKVVKTIQKEMKLPISNTKYNTEKVGNFYGVYYGQLGLKVEPDTIFIKTNETLNNCRTYNYETKKYGQVYDMEKYKTSSDKYDIYLSGATPIISIENPDANTDKELLLFRDSYGSSIAPLLVDNYKKITLIDIRYISSNLLENYIKFKDQDVLFLYSTLVLNQNILK